MDLGRQREEQCEVILDRGPFSDEIQVQPVQWVATKPAAPLMLVNIFLEKQISYRRGGPGAKWRAAF